MKPVEVFAVAVRIIGLIIYVGTGNLLFLGVMDLVLGGPANLLAAATFSIPLFAIGLWLLRRAPAVIAYAYPGEPRAAADQSPPAGRRRFVEDLGAYSA